jgi:iron complex outermembrane receptor protein
MGGVVNLISRRPGGEPEREVMLNRSSRGATDAIVWYSTPLRSTWSLSMLAGGHWQEQADVDGDGWSDLPGYSRGVVRPRLFWSAESGSSLFITAGATIERREGGAAFYREALDTQRFDTGFVGQTIWGGRFVVTTRAAFSRQNHDHVFGEAIEDDEHSTGFGEFAIRGTAGRHTWVAGAAIERDQYRTENLRQFDHTFTVPGVFVQDDVTLTDWLSVSASARLDRHSEYGTFVSPRLAAFFRAGTWTSRLSAGTGFFGPSALTEETEAAGLSRLTIPQSLRAEEGSSASVDLSRTQGALSYTATFFASRVRHPIHVDRSRGLILTNAARPSTNVGLELLGTLRHEPFALTANYTFVRSREFDDGEDREASLTPGHSAGLVGMWEREDVGRIGLELYYTGTQRLAENPYALESEPYVIVGLLVERQFGRLRLFVNGENLGGVRQSRWHPLVRPARAPDGRWTVDAWAPLDGRTVNGGIRLRF